MFNPISWQLGSSDAPCFRAEMFNPELLIWSCYLGGSRAVSVALLTAMANGVLSSVSSCAREQRSPTVGPDTEPDGWKSQVSCRPSSDTSGISAQRCDMHRCIPDLECSASDSGNKPVSNFACSCFPPESPGNQANFKKLAQASRPQMPLNRP